MKKDHQCPKCNGTGRININKRNNIVNGFKNCSVCDKNKPYTKEFFHGKSGDKLLSRCKICENAIRRNLPSKKKYNTVEMKCEVCGITYKARTKKSRYCSRVCFNKIFGLIDKKKKQLK